MRRPPGTLSRRGFLGLASAAAAGLWLPRARAAAGEPELSAFERDHLPVLRVPAVTANGAKVPIVVEMTHPMTPEHHVTSVQVLNPRDPVPSKGTFRFTPASGAVYVAFQARVHHGDSELTAIAECNLHGRWTTRRAIHVPDHAGG